jgi:hypothetical protein
MDLQTENRLKRGKAVIKDRFWSLNNVVSVGVGCRERDNERTDEPAVTVGVVKKRRPGYVRADEMLPDRIDVDGVSHKVDVVEIGRVSFCGTSEYRPPGWTITDSFRPLQPGAEITNVTTRKPDGTYEAGTISCFVKDKDDQVHILSNCHVLVNPDNISAQHPTYGDKIGQPNPDSVVAELSNYVPYKSSIFASNTMDCATAKLIDQSGWLNDYPGNRMAQPSSKHKAFGLYFASNSDHSRGWMVRLEPMLQQLGMRMLIPDSTVDIDGNYYAFPIEKVGARTGYSSSSISNTDDSVKIHMDDGWYYNFDHVIETRQLGWGGDSGSLVCIGGDGATVVPLEHTDDPGCSMFNAVGTMYNLPLNGDIALGDRIRDEFLAQTRLGALLTHLFYLNSEVVINRSKSSPTSDSEKAGAHSLYDRYRNFVATAMNNPRDPSYVVTQSQLDDTVVAINGAAVHMYDEESSALNDIYTNVIAKTLGMRYDDLLRYMNDDTVYHSVLDRLSKVKTIVTEGVIGPG